MEFLRKLYLKAVAHKHLKAYRTIAAEVACGDDLLQTCSTRARQHALEFDRSMDALCVIDPTTPPFRLTAIKKGTP